MSYIRRPWMQRKPSISYGVDWSDPISQGLVGRWLFNEGRGNTVFDISQNSQKRNGNLTSGPTWSPGAFGSALGFDGSASYIAVPGFIPSVDIGNGRSFSIAYWVYPTAASQHMHVGNSVSASRFYTEQFPRTGIIYFHWGIGTQANNNTSLAVLNLNEWTHVAVTYDGNVAKTYSNGVERNSDAIGSQSFASGEVRFGKYTDASPLLFNGKLDNISIHNRALSGPEITRLYKEPFAGIKKRKLWIPKGAVASTFKPYYASARNRVIGVGVL